MYSLWEEEFNDYPGARMGKCFYSKPDAAKAKYVIKLSRSNLSRFVRIISGHNSLFYFRHLVDNEVNAICRFCLETDETLFHLVSDCPKFWNTRRNIFCDRVVSNDMTWWVNELLEFSNSPGINEALEGDTRIELYRQHEDMVSSTSGSSSDDRTQRKHNTSRPQTTNSSNQSPSNITTSTTIQQEHIQQPLQYNKNTTNTATGSSRRAF